ncbi:MAG: hypothetical protein KAT34_18175 [Candidatus Aminicenantes bacterium]|nr:hypothetical protein [Candidatus Aminicenantes bacterium]
MPDSSKPVWVYIADLDKDDAIYKEQGFYLWRWESKKKIDSWHRIRPNMV